MDKFEKIKLIKKMIDFLTIHKDRSYYGICYAYLRSLIKDTSIKTVEYRLTLDIPELLPYKPEKLLPLNYWFPQHDTELRIKILNEILNKLQNDNK